MSLDFSGGPGGSVGPAGALTAVKIETPQGEMKIDDILHFAYPHKGLTDSVKTYRKSNTKNIDRGLGKIVRAEKYDLPIFYGLLWGKIIRGDGEEIDLGIISTRVVTTAGVNLIRDTLAAVNTTTLQLMKFHGIGTGTTAEAAADTALVTELTTEYNPNATRATGTQVNSVSTVYTTVATNTLDSGTPAVTEHGIFSATSAGTLLDRSVFAAINLVGANGDGLQTTYSLTINAGG